MYIYVIQSIISHIFCNKQHFFGENQPDPTKYTELRGPERNILTKNQK